MNDVFHKLLNVHSMRLFPKGNGADAYQVTGLAARCDWVLLSDSSSPEIHLHKNVDTSYPQHIFLSMRSPFIALGYFANHVLPTLTTDFVLISGSGDITIPNQMDKRWRKFNNKELSYIDQILGSTHLKRWFCENLDDDSHHLLSPMPVGMVFSENYPTERVPFPNSPPFRERERRILCAHRIREQPQWELRKQVTQLALSDWADFCTVLKEEVPEEEFIELIHQHAFVLCVEGGGLDPSPKAWLTILNGSVPIIRSTALRTAYEELPVVFVPTWQPNSISENFINRWYYHLKEIYNEQFKRNNVQKLGLDYWWNKVLMCQDDSSV